MSNVRRAWPQEAATTLRIFGLPGNAGDGSGELSPRLTLSQLYELYVLPICLRPKKAALKNLKQYAESVGYWARFTGDPPLEAIDDYTLARFLEGLAGLPGRDSEFLSNNTIRKHCIHVQAVLAKAGPRSRQNKKGLGLLLELPFLDPPPAIDDDPEDGFTPDEYSRIMDGCHVARRPEIDGLPPAVYWRSKYTLIGNTGMRIGSAMKARFDRIDGDWIPIEIKRGRVQRFFLNDAAKEAIEWVRGPRALLYPWPSWPSNESRMFAEHQKILAAAAIPPARRWGFKGFRRYVLTELSGISPIAAQLAAGHRDGATTQKNYIGRRVMTDALRKLPQSKWKPHDARQLDLFS